MDLSFGLICNPDCDVECITDQCRRLQRQVNMYSYQSTLVFLGPNHINVVPDGFRPEESPPLLASANPHAAVQRRSRQHRRR